MPFRFVHAADIHLDSPLRSLALRDRDLAELVGNATRRAFTGIVDLCVDERVDALLLAGDLYDGEQTSMKTARFLADEIGKLHEAGIDVFVIRGNHDALSKITKELTFPNSVKIFGARAEAIPLVRDRGALPVTIHGLSFARPHAPESLLPSYRPPVDGAVNIGLMHTSLDGSPGHDLYAPCRLIDLRASGFDYWALGHIHGRSAMAGNIVMPGMPQGRDINEAGPKSVTIVTIGDDRAVALEERLTSVAQFERVTVDLSGIDDWHDMADAVGRALERTREAAPSEHVIARLRLTGRTPLAWRLRCDTDLLAAEFAARAARTGKCWVEKVEIACDDNAARSASGPSAGALAELRRLFDDEVMEQPSFRMEASKIAKELRDQLPTDCRGILGMDEAGFEASLAAAVRDGVEDVFARLRGAAPEPGS